MVIDVTVLNSAKEEASQQLGRPIEIVQTNISNIRAFDTIFHDGKVKTVCNKNIKKDSFMGTTIFGDSYMSGHKPVLRIKMNLINK